MSINITLPDGTVRQYEKGVTGKEIAADISEGLARMALAVSVNGQLREVDRTIEADSDLTIHTWRDEGGKNAFWHSSAHILAEAILQHYPQAKLGFGPPIREGFYYDVDFGEESFGEGDFDKIEKTFMELARSGETFVRKEISKADAIAYYKGRGNEYKVELIEGLEDGSITFYESGDFVDLCKGGHIPNSKVIKAFKILKVAGAYWRGDEKNKQLTRLYAISFPKAKELKEYLEKLEEAKKRDHRKIGKEMGLFAFSEKVGLGLPLWLPKGTRLRETLVDFLKRVQLHAGYDQVVTPHIGKKELYQTSGHWDKYGEDSFQPIKTPVEGESFLLKPMNCPHHCEIFGAVPRSYRDLPLRLAEFGTVYRYEQHGELHGLTRVRGFTQDDAHIFCRPDQVKDEFKAVIEIVLYILRILKFEEFTAQVSLRDPNNPSKYIGDTELWDRAENDIRQAAAEMNLKTVEVEGEAAFYGPKLDFMVRDALGREWQLGTVQVDYNLPERFELEYTGTDNAKHRPVMIHRAPFGSLERFTAVLIEHTAGDFPLWLAPEQGIILPVSDKYIDYATKVNEQLRNSGFRFKVDHGNDTIGKKIRNAEVGKYPYMLVVGETEEQSSSVAVRKRHEGDKGVLSLEDFVKHMEDEIEQLIA
ncbi:MAG: threonine--tRNA ligase [Bacteroidia bacterium]